MSAKSLPCPSPGLSAVRLSPINLKILAYTLDVEGFDSSAVLQRCGIASFDDLQENGEWVALDLFDQMMAAAIEVTGDTAFGLVAGKSLALEMGMNDLGQDHFLAEIVGLTYQNATRLG